ncbi:MAG TPA: YfiR family protein [Burkholderiales bacterium]|nr:YfiR family protein [Burkholderiales bacterium]
MCAVPMAAHAETAGDAPVVVAEAEATAVERSVKAAYLYKFAGYVEWPEGSFPRPDSPLTFGVMGDEAFAGELSRLVTGRSVAGRPLSVRRVREGEPLTGLHILFVGRADDQLLDQVSRAVANRPVLVVSEFDSGLARGSTINFVVAEGRVKFAISAESAEKHSLKLSSRLLTVAQNMGAP